jgi:predicted aspartyl protease
MNLTRGSFFVGLSAALVPPAARAAPVTSVPLAVRNNRIYATFGVPVPSGARAPVEFAIDTGGGALVIARRTATRLGLKTLPKTSDKPSSFVPIALDTVYVGDTRIPLGFAATTVADTDQYAPGAASAGFFAGAFLGDHVVTYDYLNGALWLDGPPLDGGVPQALRIDPKSGFPRIELTIDGETYGFLFDTGASFTMLSNAVVERLRNKHPEWPYVPGAYGPANMMGGPETHGAMMRMRDVRWGDVRLGDVDVVTRYTGTFENYMSSITAGNIVGALGGNVLRTVAARLDYPRATLTVRYRPRPRPDELTVVPLILEPHDDGTFTISGGTAADGLTGKQLISVDRRPVAGLSMDDVQQLLRGPVGAERSIEVRGEHPVARRIVAIF